jgi:NAD(P)-dependent dehydrogenase (short-subunit alcohol dehydrogenase family)
MSTRLIIITGASRGLGAALAEQLLQPGVVMLCLSRQRHPTLAQLAASMNAELEQWPRDLADSVTVADELEQWLRGFDARRFDRAELINNAGVIPTLGPVDGSSNAELSAALRVGLESAVLLTASFLRASAAWHAERRVLNISSGLGRHAMAGSAVYCGVKAGMDHFSRAVALDEAHREGQGSGYRAARIVSLAPGVVDTDMQVQLRSAEPDGFPSRDKFEQLHTSGQLVSAQATAEKIIRYLDSADFGADAVADIRLL